MVKNKKPTDFQKINPDDFYNYEDRFVEKGGGGGKSSGHKGIKTIRALKKQQRIQSVEERRKEIEDSLKSFLSGFSNTDNPDTLEKNLTRYCTWVEEHLRDFGDLEPSDCVITFAKSGGPGGQNVNKRETKVMIIHKPTNFRVDSDQTRSQLLNKNVAMKNLREGLQEHLEAWKEYLEPGQEVNLEMVKLLMD